VYAFSVVYVATTVTAELS